MDQQPASPRQVDGPLRVLLLEDRRAEKTRDIAEALEQEFGATETLVVTDQASFEERLRSQDFDAVVSNHPLKWSTWLSVVRGVKGILPTCPILFFSNAGDAELVSEAMKSGLDDFVSRSEENLVPLAAALRAAFERLDTEASVAHLRTRMRGLLNRLNVGVFRANRKGRILEANPAFSRLLAVSSEQVEQGVSLSQFFLNPADLGSILERLRQDGRQIQREIELLPFDSKPIWVSFTIAPATLEDESDGFEGMVEDVTARRLAEASLQEEQATTQALLDALPDTIWRLSSDGTFLELKQGPNDAPTATTPVVGQRFDDVFAPELAQLFFRHAEKAARTRQIQILEFPTEDESGKRYYEARVVAQAQGDLLVIVRNNTERHEAEERQAQAQAQLRSLAEHLQSVREEERARIAAQIHDELGQALTALKLDVCWLESRTAELDSEIAPKTHAMTELLDRTVETVRVISTELRPRLLDELGLVDAIVWQTREFKRRLGIRTELEIDPIGVDLAPDLVTAAFRIFQELLTNVARHADAQRVDIELRRQGDSLVLRVQDDGRGIRPEEITDPGSFGLLELSERAQMWDGKVHIRAGAKGGTIATVILQIPEDCPDASEADDEEL